jgi:hypothetical protein
MRVEGRPICESKGDDGIYAEPYSSRQEALERERQIKRWTSQKKELLVRGDVAALSGTSQRARIRTGFTWENWLTQL